MSNLKIIQFLLFFYCLFCIQKASSQTTILTENQYHYIYKISPQDNYTYGTSTKSPKEIQYKLRKIFASIYSWYDNSQNVFYIKTSDTLKSTQAYSDFLNSKGFLLVSPIEIYQINPINPFPSTVYNYKYTLHLQGDFSNWRSKNVIDTLNILFQTDATWYNSIKNIFYIKTTNQSKTIQDYTQILGNSSLILSQTLTIENIKTNILNSDSVKETH